MKEKNKKDISSNTSASKENSPDNDKLDIGKSVFQTNREMLEKMRLEEKAKQDEIQRVIEEREKKKQEAYDRRIREERIELMRLKQGLIEESETIHEEHEAPVKMSFGKKIVNFFYHNKWWLGIGTLFAFIVCFLVYSFMTKPHPDMVVLVIADNVEIGEMSKLEDYFEGFAEDTNGDGKVQVSVYYIPYSDDDYKNYTNGADNKLTTQLQSADSVIVIGGKKLVDMIGTDNDLFVDLEDIFPDDINVHGFKYMLTNTPFASRIGVDEKYVTYDLFIAVRTPTKLLYSSKKDMQKTFDKDWPVFEKIIADLAGSN